MGSGGPTSRRRSRCAAVVLFLPLAGFLRLLLSRGASGTLVLGSQATVEILLRFGPQGRGEQKRGREVAWIARE